MIQTDTILLIETKWIVLVNFLQKVGGELQKMIQKVGGDISKMIQKYTQKMRFKY